MKLDKILCCMFLISFFGLDRAQKHNSCLLLTEELTSLRTQTYFRLSLTAGNTSAFAGWELTNRNALVR